MKKLHKLLGTDVGILSCETDELIRVVSVSDITEGSDFYIDEINNEFVLIDFQDESDSQYLGTTIEEALYALSEYEYYFNNDSIDGDGWVSDFLYTLK